MLALALLKYAATGSFPLFDGPEVSPLDRIHDREFRWVIDAGLGPLLYRATRDRPEAVPASWREVLLSAELTAQVWNGNLVDIAIEIVDVCAEAGVPVTLLKGISISDQYYPAAHLRPMGDIDVLIPAEAYETVEASLLQSGYVRKSGYIVDEGAAHGIPLVNSKSGAWVEIHTGLFDGIEDGATFGLSHLRTQRVASTFHGRPLHRLSDELQLLYIAYSWFQDMAKYSVKIQPSGLPPLFDAVYLLRSRATALDWDGLLEWGGNGTAIASLYSMLTYLVRGGFDCGVAGAVPRLATKQNIVGTMQLRVIHSVLDRYLIGGRKWNLSVPLPVPGRYNVGYQIGKRRGRQRLEP